MLGECLVFSNICSWRFHSTLVRTPVEWCVDFIDSPGRFLAANELKCLMGYVLLNYDIKWSNRDFLEGGYAPPNEVLGVFTGPAENVVIMFRRRIGD